MVNNQLDSIDEVIRWWCKQNSERYQRKRTRPDRGDYQYNRMINQTVGHRVSVNPTRRRLIVRGYPRLPLRIVARFAGYSTCIQPDHHIC